MNNLCIVVPTIKASSQFREGVHRGGYRILERGGGGGPGNWYS